MRRFRSFASSWSFHKYPTSTCLNKTTSIAELLSDASSDKLGTYFQQFTVPAVKMGLKARVGETNSASCGGSFGVSDTMASALWSLDYLFALATHQVSRVNFHGGNSGPIHGFLLLMIRATAISRRDPHRNSRCDLYITGCSSGIGWLPITQQVVCFQSSVKLDVCVTKMVIHSAFIDHPIKPLLFGRRAGHWETLQEETIK